MVWAEPWMEYAGGKETEN